MTLKVKSTCLTSGWVESFPFFLNNLTGDSHYDNGELEELEERHQCLTHLVGKVIEKIVEKDLLSIEELETIVQDSFDIHHEIEIIKDDKED